jgi:hypothetical protein
MVAQGSLRTQRVSCGPVLLSRGLTGVLNGLLTMFLGARALGPGMSLDILLLSLDEPCPMDYGRRPTIRA